jgi:5'-nucleotidase
MSSNPIILIDQDNVIADQLGHFHALLTRDHPDVWETWSGKTTSYEIEADFAPEHAELIKGLRLQEGFFRDLPVIAGAKEGIQALKDAGYKVYVCTAPIWQFHPCVAEKLNWLAREFGHDTAAKSIIARDKTFIGGGVLIDDKPAISGECTPVWTHVLYDQPYNKDTNKPRVSWNDIPKMLDTIAHVLAQW